MSLSFPFSPSGKVTPRIIIHGGAGNITRENLPQQSWKLYKSSLLSILHASNCFLQEPGARAIDIATHAVMLLENNPLFNAGHGAVFTREGTNELEASIMVSNTDASSGPGYRKRGVGVMLATRIKNPIIFAREMLIRGDHDDGGGAQGHCQLAGEEVERLAEEWGVEMVHPDYFWTKKRWQEHKRGLDSDTKLEDPVTVEDLADDGLLDAVEDGNTQLNAAFYATRSWDGKEYLPQGTVGAVVLDSFGTICVATSTGGLTNKLPGRIGDTPTLGAGFWAEEWDERAFVLPQQTQTQPQMLYRAPAHALSASSPLDQLVGGDIAGALARCIPSLGSGGAVDTPSYTPPDPTTTTTDVDTKHPLHPTTTTITTTATTLPLHHALAISGTGNGDSFLRLAAARTACALVRFAAHPPASLADAVARVAGPGGMLQRSAAERWK
ncbi:hypothetical protein LTR28_011512, partial [Elasticomyces elasticus]